MRELGRLGPILRNLIGWLHLVEGVNWVVPISGLDLMRILRGRTTGLVQRLGLILWFNLV